MTLNCLGLLGSFDLSPFNKDKQSIFNISTIGSKSKLFISFTVFLQFYLFDHSAKKQTFYLGALVNNVLF